MLMALISILLLIYFKCGIGWWILFGVAVIWEIIF